jgi:hypothetical protein
MLLTGVQHDHRPSSTGNCCFLKSQSWTKLMVRTVRVHLIPAARELCDDFILHLSFCLHHSRFAILYMFLPLFLPQARTEVVMIHSSCDFFLYTLHRCMLLPSGGLTLILGTQKWRFSCKVQRLPPADIFLNESLPPKTPLRTPYSWPPWPWFSREKSLKISKFCKKHETLTLTLKICILQENEFKELTLVLFESLF